MHPNWWEYYIHNDSDDVYMDSDNLPDTLKPENLLSKKKDPKDDGMNCKLCKEWFHMAEPNQEDGTLICRTCKLNPYRSSKIYSDD
jgi:hypothetical protein